MKKVITILFAASFVLFLSACSQKEEGNTTTTSPMAEQSGNTQNATPPTSQVNNSANTSNNNSNNMADNNNQAGPGDNSALVAKYTVATIKTNLGDIEVKLDASNAPIAVGNFLKLASTGFYDGVRFHRVIKGFMIQGGDPISKDDAQKAVWGTGGPGYTFADELKGTETYPQGTLAMANAGPNTNGSQFFIVTASPSAPLPPSYTVFGHVTSGMDVALKIQDVQTNPANNQPLEDVTIKSVQVLEK